MYDLVIIGGGPAGVSAGIYAARKKLNTILITTAVGGQSFVSPSIHNWIGDTSLSGVELAKKFKTHLEEYTDEGLELKTGKTIQKIEKKGESFVVTDTKGDTYETKVVLITAGAERRKLQVPGADEYEHRGLTYCASCDGPLFSGKDVVVIGGGNAGFETAAQLLAYTNSVTLLQRSERYRADQITVEKVLANKKMTGILGALIKEVHGDGSTVTGIVYTKNGQGIKLEVQGVFVEIGLIASTKMIDGLLETDPTNRIVVNPKNQRTSVLGIWAAGDCTDGLYHQNNIAAGDAVKAIEDIYLYLTRL